MILCLRGTVLTISKDESMVMPSVRRLFPNPITRLVYGVAMGAYENRFTFTLEERPNYTREATPFYFRKRCEVWTQKMNVA